MSSMICDPTGLGETDSQLKLGMPETSKIETTDLLKRAEISTTTRVQYMHPDEVRKILVKMGFELTEPEDHTTYCDMCGAPLCEECGTTGLCSACGELWEAEIDLEGMETEEECDIDIEIREFFEFLM